VSWKRGREGAGRVVRSQEGVNRLEHCPSFTVGKLGERPLEQLDGQDVSVPGQQLAPGRRQPHETTAAIGRIVLPLDQAVLLEVGDDVAHHRLGSVEVVAQLADCDRAGERKVLERSPGRRGQRRALRVAPMEPEVHRRELPGEDLGGLVRVHPITLRTG
jgi:hypothetical protein